MQIKYGFLPLFLVGLLTSGSTLAQELAFSRNARTFETINSGLLAKSLGFSCLNLYTRDGLPCSPTALQFSTKPMFSIDGQVSNGYSTISSIKKIIDNNVDEQLFDDLFSKSNIVQVDAGAQINFTSQYFSAQYNPASMRGFLVARNEADPDIELFSILEKGFTAQTNYPIIEDLIVGLQARFVSREFVKRRFKLVEIGTDQGKAMLKAKTQRATYLEPAVTWVTPLPWKTRATLMYANLGFYSEEYAELRTPSNLQGGIAISPPVGFGNLDVSLDWRSLTYEEEGIEHLRLGVMYGLGSMSLATGLDNNGMSLGIFYSLQGIRSGITYSTTRFINDDEFYSQTVYVQLGYEI